MVGAPRPVEGGVDPVPVLLYHDVADAPLPGQARWTVGLRTFQRHMALVKASGRVPVTVTQYAESLASGTPVEPPGRRPVLVTFDDGYASWPAAIATMATEGVRSATVYVTTGHRDAPGMAPWRELAALPDWVEIGAHSVDHPQLDVLPRKAVLSEVAESKRDCERFAGQPCRSFAYPHGFHTRYVRQAVIDAGYISAAAVKNALSHHLDDAYAVARVTIAADTTDQQVQSLLQGFGAPLAWSGERLRTRGFRAYRRTRAAAHRSIRR